MKVLHAAFMMTPVPGVVNQMQWELTAAAEQGLDWDTRLFCRYNAAPVGRLIVPATRKRRAGGRIGQFMDSFQLHRDYFQWLRRVAPSYDAILMRYNASDPLQARFIKATATPVFLVHHTLEVPELLNSYQSYSKWLRLGLERLSEKPTAAASRGIVAVTGEILNYERGRTRSPQKAGYIYPNGIYYCARSDALLRDERTDVPEILFVASHFARWHGLDLLLDSLARSKSQFVLHLVGTLQAQDLTRAKQDERIRLHGLMGMEEIEVLSRRCWLGLSSFALERKEMEQACTLKVREYLLNGLPVYANYRDVFPDEFLYYKKGPPDIEHILNYGRSVRSAARTEVAEAARPFISKSNLLLGLHAWLHERLHAGSAQRSDRALT